MTLVADREAKPVAGLVGQELLVGGWVGLMGVADNHVHIYRQRVYRPRAYLHIHLRHCGRLDV